MTKSAALGSAALGFALLLATATGAYAQDGKPDSDPVPTDTTKPADDKAKPTDDEAKADDESEAEVEAVRGVRYRIELKSGGVLDGVVRAKGVFERRSRFGGYEPSDETDEAGGVRIWFPSRQDGFIFMPISSISRIDELGSLSVDEGKTISRARVASRRRAQGERSQIRARRLAAEKAAQARDEEEAAAETETETGEPVDGEAAAASGSVPAETESTDDEAQLASLLLKYPPTRWSPDSPDEIERRKVVLGLFPSDEETAFLATFDDWLKAYNSWLSANGEEVVEEKRPERTKRPKRQSPRGRPSVKRPDTPSWKNE